MPDEISINLVKGRKPHFLDQFIGWALTVGRALVIVTETVALSAFLYRFGLDRQIIDLHDKITQEQNIVNFLKKDEAKFRNLQDRLQLASTILASETTLSNTYQNIINYIPSDMTIKTLTVSTESIIIEADTKSVSSVSTFISKLKANPDISGINLDSISNKTSTGIITIGLTASFKK